MVVVVVLAVVVVVVGGVVVVVVVVALPQEAGGGSACVWPMTVTRRSCIAAAASPKLSQRPVRTSTSDAISSPTTFGARSVSIAAA